MHASTQHTPTKAHRHSRTHVCVMKVRRKVRWKDGYISRLLTRTRAVEQNWQRTFFPFPFRPVLFSPPFFRCFRVSLALYRSFLAYCPLALNDLCACCGLRVHFAVAWPRVATEARVEVNKNWLLALHLSNVVAGLALQQQPCNFTPAAPFVVVSST